MKHIIIKLIIPTGLVSLLGLFVASSLSNPPVSASDASSMVNVNLDPVISLTTSTGAVDIDITPMGNSGVFNSDSADVLVSTNNGTGYQLYMQISGEDNSNSDTTSLVHTVTDDEIKSIAGTLTSANFTDNTWGYSLDDTNFLKIPANGNPDLLKKTATAAKNDTTPITIGAKVNSELPAGIYTNKLLFTAVANYNPDVSITAWDKLYYMQDMTPSTCASAGTVEAFVKDENGNYVLDEDGNKIINADVPEKYLVDARDGNKYRVRKLADGSCWMTENLRLDLSTKVALTPDDSDVEENWTPDLDTSYDGNVPWAEGSNWNDYSKVTAADFNTAKSYHSSMSIDSCSMVDNSGQMVTAENCTSEDSKVGNFYNFYAATAGEGTYENSNTATSSSICPRGWSLQNQSGNKSFANLLLDVYDLSQYADNNVVPYSKVYRLLNSPFSFSLSGQYRWDTKFSGVWASNMFWTNQPQGQIYAYRFPQFMSNDKRYDGVHIGNFEAGLAKLYGMSIRCVSKS